MFAEDTGTSPAHMLYSNEVHKSVHISGVTVMAATHVVPANFGRMAGNVGT